MKQFFKFMFASCLGSGLAMIASFFIIILIVTSMISSLSKNDSNVQVNGNSVLVIDFSRPVYDREVNDLQTIFSPSGINSSTNIGLTELLQVIQRAKKDKNISAVCLNMSIFQANGIATAQEIREALLDFKSSGKKVFAYGDQYDQKSYYVASIADKIVVNPAGMIMLSGMGGEVMFLKDLVNKLDIDVDLIRPKSNAFKSAGEQFTMNHMSDSNKLQTKQYIQSIWNVISKQMCESRHIDEVKFNNIVSNLQGVMPKDALKNKIVDILCYKSDFKDSVANYVVRKNNLKSTKNVNFISYTKYRQSIADLFKAQDKNIAIVYAYGDVAQGKGTDLSIGSQTVCKAIERAASNDKVKAIVLRVNSPGGDAIASELITNEVIKAKRKKPVIISMGDMAASAGYEISSNASYIVASPTTITGSIGVFGVLPNFNRALKNKLGITFDTVKTHANSNPLSVTTPMTPQAKALMQNNVENFYMSFVNKVAKGRNKTSQYISSIAKGRVWSGVDGKRLGLVDDFGGLQKAIQIAAKMTNLQSYGIVEYPKVQSVFEQILTDKETDMKIKSLTKELGKPYSFFLTLKHLSDMQGVQMRMDYIINL